MYIQYNTILQYVLRTDYILVHTSKIGPALANGFNHAAASDANERLLLGTVLNTSGKEKKTYTQHLLTQPHTKLSLTEIDASLVPVAQNS